LTDQAGDEDQHLERVRSDHIVHKFAIFAVAAYGLQLHGWLVGLAILIGQFVVISATNLAILAIVSDKKVFRNLRLNRWAWVILSAIVVGLSGATIEAAQ
jgi:hypothetical protein